ncbi:MAG: hypothetical protein ABR610_02825 [Thermoanaerobaculia bacterium]|nr:hypothetical protein [Acidobacteriota bacterium]
MSGLPPRDIDSGPYLDRLIELKVFGRKPVTDPPPYSTDDAAAERVIAQLNRPPLRWMAIREENAWTFSWRQPAASPDLDTTATRYVRLISASAPTRPLAICRAALKLVTSRS